MSSGASGIPLKYSYGSDFPCREADRYLPRDGANIGLLPSFGRGGQDQQPDFAPARATGGRFRAFTATAIGADR